MCTLRPPSWNSGTWQFLVMLLPSKIWFKPLEGTLTCYTATTIPRLTYIPFCLFYLQFCTVIWNSTNGFVTQSRGELELKMGIWNTHGNHASLSLVLTLITLWPTTLILWINGSCFGGMLLHIKFWRGQNLGGLLWFKLSRLSLLTFFQLALSLPGQQLVLISS